MPTGQSDGSLSTVWCHPRCVMVKTRPLNVIRTQGRFRARRTPGPEGLRVTVFTARRRCVINAHWSIRRLSEHRMG